VRSLHYGTGQDAYPRIVKLVLREGTGRAPRGEPTYELGPTTIVLESPYRSLPLNTGRSVSGRVAAAEAIQLIGAFHDPRLMLMASPNFARYVEPDGVFHGAYGQRVGDQLSHVVSKLRVDPDTRQAVVTLWNPELDNTLGKKDYPCTVALGFSIQGDRLHMTTVMRSNDVWLGLPYDLFQFTQLQLTLARVLGIAPGTYTHTAWSLHLYDRDVTAAAQLFTAPEPFGFQPDGLGVDGEQLIIVQQRARVISQGELDLAQTESERWYGRQLAQVVG